MAQPYLGEIMMFGGNFAIYGWQMCNGQLLPISQYSALFSILGTTFGGNGTTNFALPDLRGRVPVHQGTGNGLSTYVIGEQTGVENVTLLLNNMPLHNHLVNCNSAAAPSGGTSPANNFPAAVNSGTTRVDIYAGSANATMAPAMIQAQGGNIPHTNIQPLLCVTFLIALQGIFPSRN